MMTSQIQYFFGMMSTRPIVDIVRVFLAFQIEKYINLTCIFILWNFLTPSSYFEIFMSHLNFYLKNTIITYSLFRNLPYMLVKYRDTYCQYMKNKRWRKRYTFNWTVRDLLEYIWLTQCALNLKLCTGFYSVLLHTFPVSKVTGPLKTRSNLLDPNWGFFLEI